MKEMAQSISIRALQCVTIIRITTKAPDKFCERFDIIAPSDDPGSFNERERRIPPTTSEQNRALTILKFYSDCAQVSARANAGLFDGPVVLRGKSE